MSGPFFIFVLGFGILKVWCLPCSLFKLVSLGSLINSVSAWSTSSGRKRGMTGFEMGTTWFSSSSSSSGSTGVTSSSLLLDSCFCFFSFSSRFLRFCFVASFPLDVVRKGGINWQQTVSGNPVLLIPPLLSLLRLLHWRLHRALHYRTRFHSHPYGY